MTPKVGRKLGIVAMTLALVGFAPCSAAAQAASQSTTRCIVGSVAGGVLDPYARLIADHMSKSLSRTIIVENKPGANGNVSASGRSGPSRSWDIPSSTPASGSGCA